MAVLGKLLKNRRAGEDHLAWNAPNLAGPDTLTLTSPDFAHEATMPTAHVAKRYGGQDLSPALAWSNAPAGTAQYLLMVEDPDVPLSKPVIHCAALLDSALTALPQGALDAATPADGVQLLRSVVGRGYHGPGPIKGHGPHSYVFELFALAAPVTAPDAATAKTRMVIGTAGPVLARARLDGIYERR
ncbi:YbhB/YbcL family Raf kinase inhibitor-like protein [Kribbella sp. NPDC059898]|uniref:YbhB/YbcL family Raf kinase inhibitor-like protein n=1 Tax=Kribbella sp. NPDC059898 TaxID=3346995 RepID=UPI00365200F8